MPLDLPATMVAVLVAAAGIYGFRLLYRSSRPVAWAGLALAVVALAEIGLRLVGSGSFAPLTTLALVAFTITAIFVFWRQQGQLESELSDIRAVQEQMVEDRTTELANTNRRLEAEIAERRMAEEAMRMLERAVEQSVDGLAVIDMYGNAQYVNEAWAQMHGFEVYEVLGHHVSIFHSAEQMRDQLVPLIEEVREKGAGDAEVGHRTKDGHEFPAWMSVTLLQDPEKGLLGFVAFARDVTERNRAAQEQQRLQTRVQQARKLESLGVLAAGIAHDYNNLLTSLLGNASVALRELPADSPVVAKIRQIQAAAERAVDLSGQLLTYAGEDPLSLRTLQLNEVVEEVRQALEAPLPEHLELRLRLKDGLPPVEVDPAQIRQVVVNLVTNAVEASGGARPAIISVRTRLMNVRRSYLADAFPDEGQAEGRYVLLSVADTGSGIDEETRAKMFDPFFTTRGPGRGLGLAAVLGIVRGHRGAIKVFSDPGRGTTIEVLFPVKAEEATADVVVGGGDLDTWQSTGTILVVDDEELVREVAEFFLREHGFEVLTADDGGPAVEVFRRRGADIRVVLLDTTMPQMSGEQTFYEIRRLDPKAKIILMSGYTKKEMLRSLMAEGLAGFLQKPFRPENLLQKVREVLDG